MYHSFQEVIKKAKDRDKGPLKISVSVAEDKDVLEAVKLAQEARLAQAILVGDQKKIKPLIQKVGLSPLIPIIDEPDVIKAASKAASLVNKGQAQILMKGLINSSDFLKSVLNSEEGLRTGRLLSHLAVFEIPNQSKLVFHTDGGMNIAPNVKQKKEILINALLALQAMGIVKPKVAILTANEKINSKMSATVDAQALVEMAQTGELPSCIIEGPIALDVALSKEACSHKGLKSKISGEVDLFLLPNIEAANIFGKSLIYYAKAKMAGLVLGATNPIVMTSRAETAEGKLNSIALACLAYKKEIINKGDN